MTPCVSPVTLRSSVQVMRYVVVMTVRPRSVTGDGTRGWPRGVRGGANCASARGGDGRRTPGAGSAGQPLHRTGDGDRRGEVAGVVEDRGRDRRDARLALG